LSHSNNPFSVMSFIQIGSRKLFASGWDPTNFWLLGL
jgi:hypothetical protein